MQATRVKTPGSGVLHATDKFGYWLTNHQSFSDYLFPIRALFDSKLHPDSGRIAAKVIAITWQNKNIYTITLKPERRKFHTFEAGQHLQIEVTQNGRRLSRIFSISSAPHELEQHGIIQLSIRKQQDGKVTPWLCENLKSGDCVHISPAQGEFTLNNSPRSKLFIAAGSGITPILSMLMQHLYLHQSFESGRNHLIYFVKTASDMGFQNELERLRTAGMDITIRETSKTGHFDNTDLDLTDLEFGNTEAYLCGPFEMIQSCQNALFSRGLNEKYIHFELFGIHPAHRPESSSNEVINISFNTSNRSEEYLSENKETLLEMAESAGLNPVSGCRIGVCHQCVCQKTAGRVLNLRTNEISDSGAEEIQLCISAPIEDVSLDL